VSVVVKQAAASLAVMPGKLNLLSEAKPINMNTTQTVNAKLTYSVGGSDYSEMLSFTVPTDQKWHQWVQDLEDVAEPILRSKGADNGILSFRVDGTTVPLTIWQRFADFWYRLTWRGKPYSGSRFIPVWPMPAGL
jgi:hypothetical protein